EVHPVALLGVVEHAVATLEARGGVELARGVTRERAAVEALARAGGSAELRVVALLARDGVDGEVTTLDEGAVGVAAQRFASIVALLACGHVGDAVTTVGDRAIRVARHGLARVVALLAG